MILLVDFMAHGDVYDQMLIKMTGEMSTLSRKLTKAHLLSYWTDFKLLFTIYPYC